MVYPLSAQGMSTLLTFLVIAICVNWLRASEDAGNVYAADFTNKSFDLAYYEQLIKAKVVRKVLKDYKPTDELFQAAKPFPHLVSTDMFPKELMRAISKEVADYQQSSTGCIDGGLCHNDDYYQKAQTVFNSVDSFGPATDALHRFMRSAPFIKYLQSATGIEDLVIGHEDKDAGVHQTLANGYEKIHSDYNMDKARGLHRRIAVFLYLNPDWHHRYGGYLELWSRDLQRCEARISPDLGTMVIFATSDFSFHGHQTPLACPPNRSHRMLAMYYYTRGRPSSDCLQGNCFLVHQERYQTTQCSTCEGQCYQNAEK